MGALAHYLEGHGVPTTQISLIRKHTEIIQPPRALWVPFELGRPLGAPNEAEFQRKVLWSALELFQAEQGPVLVDFPEDIPGKGKSGGQDNDWVCPVNFSAPPTEENELDKLITAFHDEMAELRPWYDLGLERRGRTAMAEFDPETVTELLTGFLQDETSEALPGRFSPAVALRLAAQDLKSYYFEAATTKPGAEVPDSKAFRTWFWDQTTAGLILKRIREMCSHSEDQELRLTGKMFIMPMA